MQTLNSPVPMTAKKRCACHLAIWSTIFLVYVCSSNVRASLWASACITAMPDTWVARLTATGSMEPTYDEKDWLIFQRVPFGQVRIGDVISFYCPEDGVPITHRVVEKLKDGRLVTKGDNNPLPDPWTVSMENFRGMLIASYSDG